MRMYNYQLAKQIVNSTSGLESASLAIKEDYCWTAETIWENGQWLFNMDEKPKIAGIKGSFWGTPVIILNFYNGDEKIYYCFEGESDVDDLTRMEQQMFWANGPISGPSQNQMDEKDIDNFPFKDN